MRKKITLPKFPRQTQNAAKHTLVYCVHSLLFALCLFIYTPHFAQTAQKYAVANIPDSLLTNAHSVVRSDHAEFELYSESEAVYEQHWVVTILDPKGENAAYHVVYYDKFHKINRFEGTLYDADGKKIRKEDTPIDRVARDGVSFYSDNRVKYIDLRTKQYPYTVEWNVKISYNGLLNYPDWSPQSHNDIAVEQSSFEVIVPEKLKSLRYKNYRIDQKPNISTEKEKKHYNWTLRQLKAFETQIFGKSWEQIMPYLSIAPAKFAIDGYEGSLDTWQNFGKWYAKLSEGRDKLPPETAAKIQELVIDAPNQREKVRRVYDFLQKNTRYVYVALGIGGWQPHPAEYVAQNGYGDCKALTNFTQSALKEIGIESYGALVRAGDEEADIDPDFPQNAFNHIFLCIPQSKDTIWLECTSQDSPFAYIGSFTDNRHVLLIQPDGGKLLKTPIHDWKNNTENSTTHASIDETGKLTFEAITQYAGLQYESRSGIESLPLEEQKKYLYSVMPVPNLQINALSFVVDKSSNPTVRETTQGTIQGSGAKSGKRLFIAPNLFNQWTITLDEKVAPYQIVLKRGFSDTDTVHIELPVGFRIENIPTAVHIENDFGHYHAETALDKGKIIYKRSFALKQGYFPVEKHPEFANFLRTVAKNDKAKVVLIKD